jgi:lysophospholipase L1-like esterase
MDEKTRLLLMKIVRSRPFIVLAVLVFLELSLRLFGYNSYTIEQIARGHGLDPKIAAAMAELMVPDEHLFYRYRPNYSTELDLSPEDGKGKKESFSIFLNELGLRGDLPPLKRKRGTFRYVCVGDSSTFGFRVEQEETYCAQLEKLLAGQYPDVNIESINMGIPGYDSDRAIKFFRRYLLPYQPDLVILGFGPFNNSNLVIRDAAELCERFTPELAYMKALNSNLMLMRLFYMFAGKVGSRLIVPREPVLKPTVSVDRYYASYREFIALGELYGFATVISDLYYDHRRSEEHQSENFYEDQAYQALESLGKRYRVPVLRLEKIFSPDLIIPGFPARPPNSRALTTDDVHPNPRGHFIIAAALSSIISVVPFAGEKPPYLDQEGSPFSLALGDYRIGGPWYISHKTDRFIELDDGANRLVFELVDQPLFAGIVGEEIELADIIKNCQPAYQLVGPKLVIESAVGRLELWPKTPRDPAQGKPFEGFIFDTKGRILRLSGRLGRYMLEHYPSEEKQRMFGDKFPDSVIDSLSPGYDNTGLAGGRRWTDEYLTLSGEKQGVREKIMMLTRKGGPGGLSSDNNFTAGYYRIDNMQAIMELCPRTQ